MHIKDHSAAMKFFRTYDNVASKGKWKEFVDEMEFDSMLQEPRTMAADGGRIGFKDGLSSRYHVPLKTIPQDFYESNPKVGGKKGDKYKINFKKSKNKTLPKKFEGIQYYKSEAEANAALKAKQKFIEEAREAKKKPYVKPEPKIIDKKIGQSTADNVVTKRYKNSATDKITKKYSSKLVPGEFESLEAVIEANKKYRIKNPIKNPPPDLETLDAQKRKKYLDKQAKSKTITSKGGYYSGPHTGTVKAHLGHAGNIWGTERITGDVLTYTPKDINQAMEAGLDHKIRKVSEKIEKIKKQKIPTAAKKKLLEQSDALLVRLASQSQGFKKVQLSDGSTFGGDRLTIDTFNEFPGKTEREINEFVKKWKDKKTWNTVEEFNNIKKATLFEANRKSSLKAASKMSKKEQKKIISEVNKKFIKLGCGMYAGGRVGLAVGSGKCITKAIAKLKSGNLSATEKKIVDDLAGGLKQMGGKGGMPKGFWTTALKGEGYFALADFANNLTKGQSLDKSFSNAIEMASLGLIDLGGNERDLMKYAKERGLDTKDMKEWMDYAQTYGKYVEGHKDLAEREKIIEASGGEEEYWKNYSPNTILNPQGDTGGMDELWEAEKKIKRAEKQLEEKGKSESIQSGKGYKDMNEMIEGVVAKEWNKPAGIAGLDRGYRKMLGMKGDEGLVWGPIGSMFRESMEKIGFDEHKALKSFTPQTVMNYHPVYGYKEDIKDVIRQGDSPMEDMLEFMKKNYPGSGLIQEALREVTKEKELEKWVDTGFGKEKRKVKTDMGSYDYDPNLLAAGGIASLMKKKW